MYRDDLEAALARARALELENVELKLRLEKASRELALLRSESPTTGAPAILVLAALSLLIVPLGPVVLGMAVVELRRIARAERDTRLRGATVVALVLSSLTSLGFLFVLGVVAAGELGLI